MSNATRNEGAGEITSAEVEAELYRAGGWITAERLAAAVGCGPRYLRARRIKGELVPGLVGDFAIAGAKGYRHVEHATEAEFDEYVEMLWRHSVAQLMHRRAVRNRRESVLVAGEAGDVQVDSGQGVSSDLIAATTATTAARA